jgi:hypothetical protein
MSSGGVHTQLEATAEQTLASVPTGLFQRSCVCGGLPGIGGTCSECRKERPQRGSTDHTDTAAPQVNPSPTRALNVATGAFKRIAFGHDFSSVPVHASFPATAVTDESVSIQSNRARQDARQTAMAVRGGQSPRRKAVPTDKVDQPVAEEEEEEVVEEGEGSADEEGGLEERGQEAAEGVEGMEENEGPETSEGSEADGSKAKEEISFHPVLSESAPPVGLVGKAMCPAPAPAPVGFSTRKSTAAAIAAMGACTWGITSPDPLKVTTRTCKDAGAWHLRVRRVASPIRTFSRQLPGQTEPKRSNSTAANFCAQVTQLDSLGSCAGSWYMLPAVKAHEAVHVTEWKTSFGTDWPTQKAVIESLSAPGAGSRSAATTSMRTSAAFSNALLTNRGSGNYPAFWGIPDPNANTDAAERVIVSPRIKDICVNARNKGWAPGGCPVCVANGIA